MLSRKHPYARIIEEVNKGNINPFDIDVRYLIDIFKSEADRLNSHKYLAEASAFIEACVKLLKLQIDTIFPQIETKNKRRITIEEVRKVLKESYNDYSLSFLYNYIVPVGRKKGSKNNISNAPVNNQNLSVLSCLHKEVNYSELAKEVREKIKGGDFRIRTIRDFIAYLFAYYEFDDVPELKFLR